MPQLDILVFKYENLNFIFSFFFLFFFNQYFLFPILLRSLYARRRLITRKVDGIDMVVFSTIFLKKFSFNKLSNFLFCVTINEIREIVMGFFHEIITFVGFYLVSKMKLFFYYFDLYRNKVNVLVWLNFLV